MHVLFCLITFLLLFEETNRWTEKTMYINRVTFKAVVFQYGPFIYLYLNFVNVIKPKICGK